MTNSFQGPILAVDDSDDDLFILQRCFDRSTLAEAHTLSSFLSGPDFLEHMDRVAEGREPFPSVVLLDINMPMMTGFEVLETLRSRREFLELPTVVFISSTDRLLEAERAEKLGATFHQKFQDLRSGVAFFDGLFDRFSR